MTKNYLEMFDLKTLKRIYQMKIIIDCNKQQFEQYSEINNIEDKQSIINKYDDVSLDEFKQLIKMLITTNNNNPDIITQILNLFD